MQVNGNGNYAPHHGYGGIDQQHYANNAYAQQAPPTASTPATTASNQSDIPKDEVGWYFVEQYYTTLSRTPEKLYLYYNKRSQYVSGNETDKVQVCVGQRVSAEQRPGGRVVEGVGDGRADGAELARPVGGGGRWRGEVVSDGQQGKVVALDVEEEAGADEHLA